MTFQEFYRKNNDKEKLPLPADIAQRVEASLCVQIHSTGARPAYKLGNMNIEPSTYHSKFEDLFRYRILNRHPNEGEDLYNWRLSNYNPLSEDIYNRFFITTLGTILQPNNYSIFVDDKTQKYFTDYRIDEKISKCLQFILNNPKGYIAVHVDIEQEYDQSNQNKPCIEFIDPANLLMKDFDSVAYKTSEGDVIYMNKQQQVTLSRESNQPIEINHNFNELPIWNCDNTFLQPFVKFADELVKNFSDDGMITKQYSYPIKQVVKPQCPTCFGSKYISVPIEGKFNEYNKVQCTTCNGEGTMSLNPGQVYTISEEQLLKLNGTLPDVARFITPDIGIPEYHMKRWMEFYTKCEESLYIRKQINVTNSGEAKKEDRKDQYAFLSAIGQFTFNNIRKAVEYISAYMNYNGMSGTYDKQDVIVVAPKQMDLMSDSDLVNELTVIQTKTDDSMILSETQYVVLNKIYRDDNVQGRINDIMYQEDPLYGSTGQGLRNKLLSGVYDTKDKTIHEKGYKILLKMSIEMTPEVFMSKTNEVLISEMHTRIDAVIPKSIYSDV
jgi:hypothetical protein